MIFLLAYLNGMLQIPSIMKEIKYEFDFPVRHQISIEDVCCTPAFNNIFKALELLLDCIIGSCKQER